MRLGGRPYRARRRPRTPPPRGWASSTRSSTSSPTSPSRRTSSSTASPAAAGRRLIDRGAMRQAHARDAGGSWSWTSSPATPVSRLSQGERQLVEIAKTLARDARIVIFDEPTTSLTRPEVRRLFDLIGRLKARGIAVIYISHALEDVLAHLRARRRPARRGPRGGTSERGRGGAARADLDDGRAAPSTPCSPARARLAARRGAGVRARPVAARRDRGRVVRAARGRGAGARGADGLGPLRARADPLRARRPLRRMARSRSCGRHASTATARRRRWRRAWPSSRRTGARRVS